MRKSVVAVLASAGLVGAVAVLGATAEAAPASPSPQFVSTTVDVPSGATTTVSVTCPTGTKVNGGGFNAVVLNGSYSGSGALGSYPEANGWRVVWSGNNYDARVTAWAVCV